MKLTLLIAAALGIVSSSGNEICSISTPKGGLPFPTSRNALKIDNNQNNLIKYFYSRTIEQGKTRYWPHDVKANTNTWDWTWASGHMDIQIEFNFAINGKMTGWLVIGYSAYAITDYGYASYNDVYFTNSNSVPNWNDQIWNRVTTISNDWDGMNFHSSITFNSNEIEFNSETIFNF